VKNNAIQLEISTLKPREDISSLFIVGSHVEVDRRKQPGINEEGGVAEVTEVYSRRGQTLYKVRYVLDNREERDVDDTIMKAWVAPVGRPTRSTQSSQQGQVLS